MGQWRGSGSGSGSGSEEEALEPRVLCLFSASLGGKGLDSMAKTNDVMLYDETRPDCVRLAEEMRSQKTDP